MKIRGFTYIEVILTVSLIIFLGALTAPSFGNFLYTQDEHLAVDELRESLGKARLSSMMGQGESEWGVALRGKNIILFQGNSYDSRNESYDEVFVTGDRVLITGFDEVLFARGTGQASVTPIITVALSGNADVPIMNTRRFSLQASGVMDEQ